MSYLDDQQEQRNQESAARHRAYQARQASGELGNAQAGYHKQQMEGGPRQQESQLTREAVINLIVQAISTITISGPGVQGGKGAWAVNPTLTADDVRNMIAAALANLPSYTTGADVRAIIAGMKWTATCNNDGTITIAAS